jgi:hypothetical protein
LFCFAEYINAECHYAERRHTECRHSEGHHTGCLYAECRRTECRYAECHGDVQGARSSTAYVLHQLTGFPDLRPRWHFLPEYSRPIFQEGGPVGVTPAALRVPT